MLNAAIMFGAVIVGIYVIFGLIKAILRSKALLFSSIYFGGYAYYNKEWPSLDMAIEQLKHIFLMM